MCVFVFFFFQAEDGIGDYKVTGVQTCALPISLNAIPDLLVRFHVWDCVQCPLELVSVEEFRAGLDVLMTCDAIREQSRHELLHRDVVLGGEFGSPFVQIFRYCDAFAHGLIPLLSSKTREVSSPACQQLRTGKVPYVVRDDGVRRAGYCQFEEEFVSWVW